MILKTVMKVAQYCTVFNYGLPRTQKDVKFQGIKIVAGLRVKPALKFVLSGNSKEKIVNKTLPYALIVDNLET